MGRAKIVGAHRQVGLPVFAHQALDPGGSELYYCVLHGRRVFVPDALVGFGMKPVKGKVAKPPKKKRARSAYVFFNMERHRLLEGENLPFKEASRRIADEWKLLSANERKPYQEMSRMEKESLAAQEATQQAAAREFGIEFAEEVPAKPKTKTKSKRQPTGYNMYMKQHISEGGSFTTAVEAWRSLSEEGRKEYIDKAAESKLEFEKAEKERVAAAGSDDAEGEGAKTAVKTKTVKKKPPRAPSGYTLFVKKEMKEGENPKITEVAAKWKGLSQSKKDKFIAEAEKIKTELANEFAAKIASGEISENEVVVVTEKSKRAGGPNAFHLFTKSRRQELEGLEYGAVTKQCAAEWKTMSNEDKAPFQEEATRLRSMPKKPKTKAKSGTKRQVSEVGEEEPAAKKPKKVKKHKKDKKSKK